MNGTNLPENVDEDKIRRTMRRILRAEEDKLHMDNPIGIIDEIEATIEDEIK